MCNKKYRRCYDFDIPILWRQFFLNLCLKLSSVILRNYKKSNWLYFLCWRSLRFTSIIGVFSRQNNELFGENIFRSSLPELFCEKGVLKNFAKFGKHLCWKLPTLLKGTPAQVLSCELSEIFKTTYFVKHLKTSASVYC